MKNLVVFLGILLFAILGYAQNWEVAWEQKFKGSQKSLVGKDIEIGKQLIFAAQDYNSLTGSDFLTVALDVVDGSVVWSDAYSSGQGQTSDYPKGILLKNDNPYIYGSSAKYESGLYQGQDFKLISYDVSGRLSVNQQYDWGFNDMPNTGIVVNDNIVLAGYSDLGHFAQPRAKTISISNATNWDYVGNGDFFTRSEIVAVASEGKFLYQTGVRYQGGTYTDTLSRQKSETVKLDLKSGAVVWSQPVGLNANDVRPVDIKLLVSGDPVITHNASNGDVIVTRLNVIDGKEVWHQSFVQGVAMQSLVVGDVIYVLITSTNKDIVMVKIDARNGRSLWRQPFAFDSGGNDVGVKLVEYNGHIVVLSTINGQAGILSLNRNGKLAGQYLYPTENGARDEAVDFILADGGGYLLLNRLYNIGSKAVVAKLIAKKFDQLPTVDWQVTSDLAIFTFGKTAHADSVVITFIEGEPYPKEWLSFVTKGINLGVDSVVFFERDIDHDITQLLARPDTDNLFLIKYFIGDLLVGFQEVVVHTLPNTPADIGVDNFQPLNYQLHQNYPNPFNPITAISFSLSEPSDVTIAIYNALGQEVAKLIDGYLPSGDHRVPFNAMNLPSGIYIYQLRAKGIVRAGRMILLK